MYADAEAADEAGAISEAKKPRIYPRPSFEREKKPLSGAERGTAQHLALQYIDLRACADEAGVRAEIARLVRDRFITQRQAEAVSVKAILEFLSSSVGRRLLNADSFERELKFTLLTPAAEVYGDDAEGEILFQGVIDLCFCEGGEYTVIDFKTDFVTSSTIEEKAKFYAPQIESYARALERMTKRPVKQKILYFLKLNRAVIVK
ncbi:MAG: PD-(D/E)XK nuclease family protein [Oscillospiraceae bacterium]|nr:PD-(D/E)XK nuclease family protein [Oscillospiraceae bacterium]